MTFCWRRFRHFVGAYIALGVAATVTHGAIVATSLDVLASDAEDVTLTEEVPPSEPSDTPTEDLVLPAEEVPGVDEGTTPPEDGALAETPVDTQVTETETAPEAQPTELPPPEEPVVEPAPGEEPTPVVEDDAPEVIPEPESSEPTPQPEPSVEDSPDSWPAEPLEPEPVAEPEELPPYSEARSTLEAVSPKVDWLYTLRAGTDYTLLTTTKHQLSLDMGTVINLLESQASNSSIGAQFCTLNLELATLNDLLAPGSDDTQPAVDADNQDVLNEISTAITQVRVSWTTESGTSWQCSQ